VVGVWRETFGSKLILKNLEEHCNRLEAWREKNSPGANAAMRKFYEQMMQTTQETKAKVAAG
jgi:hypothetical protein